MIDCRTEPARYRHWRLAVEPPMANLTLAVDERGGLNDGYELKLNSYDLAVDIELADAVQRLRFEHPEVGCVLLTSGHPRVFSAGANIRMLAQASHELKVNFCKFTNETRLAMEDAATCSGQRYLCAIAGQAAGGGYELALACERILLVDDGASAVALPEVPLLGVLPGTGGLTRLTDKRKVRRDHADVFCTLEEGMRGQRALDWRLVDGLVPRSRWHEAIRTEALAMAGGGRPANGIRLRPLARDLSAEAMHYDHLDVSLNRTRRTASFRLRGPDRPAPAGAAAALAAGDSFWPLALARQLDDALLHLRLNEPELGVWLFRSEGALDQVAAYDSFMADAGEDWFLREVRLYWKRVLKRLDLSARSLLALVEPGSCFAGTLLEIVLGADRGYMLASGWQGDNRTEPQVALSPLNFGAYPMPHGLTRLAARNLDGTEALGRLQAMVGRPLPGAAALASGLVTFAPDEIDWADEVRLAVEERSGYSPDALTGMEASLRFGGPETMESKIFARLSAWQNWLFQRPNAGGSRGALARYGSGQRPDFDFRRT
ncbi:MAG: benzoyl-CoA-dihydrodiol lyase [Alphaproteobacteria bacterium]|nr:benzoyl-CoA-dihydrodiol lyase [Alphaproteobacteria bacterium]